MKKIQVVMVDIFNYVENKTFYNMDEAKKYALENEKYYKEILIKED